LRQTSRPPYGLPVSQTLDLALIGNGTVGALVNRDGDIVWMCLPRFDGDPVFCSLLRGEAQPAGDGSFAVELSGLVRSEQEYLSDTPILVTRLFDDAGGGIQITDFAPRFLQAATLYAPMQIVLQIEPISGTPTIRIRHRPMQDYGAERMALLPNARARDGDNRVRYGGKRLTLGLTTDAPLDAVMSETPFDLDRSVTLCLGGDEEPNDFSPEAASYWLERTVSWWRDWVGSLALPAEWRDAVARAAIALKLNVAEESGAIIAAMTTSIPEAPNSSRNWDYRYCWLRDSYFVVDALYRLGDSATRGRYVDFVSEIVSNAKDIPPAPLYTITGAPIPEEHVASHLSGYRGMGPVRVGNQAFEQIQHDIYGEAILTAVPLFTDAAFSGRGDVRLFKQLEILGNYAARTFDKPDAGLWEVRGKEHVHTFSSVMCWAACDGIATIAARLELGERAEYWRAHAEHIRRVITQRAWNSRIGAFTAAMDGDTLDASLLLMQPLAFLAADDPRYVSTVRAIGRDLRRGDFIYRYIERDDFGHPENAFLVCTFWYIDALAAIGETGEARRLFENILSCRNRHGLLAEDLDPQTREQWGNFVQTYSMAGIISSAIRLSAS
jgi:GH15 family glucan-1,4-alpha-glucosidase